MTQTAFDQILDLRIAAMRQTLAGKGAEYGIGGDRLHNFKVAAQLESAPQSPEQALWGMLKKHIVSIIDIVAATGRGECPTQWLRNEKLGDAINYLILLEALLVERENKEQS
jgi:hypothetical protein